MRTYDLAFGIGGACCCSQALRNAGLQYASFPWDWVARSDIRVRINHVRDDFADWLRREDLERMSIPEYGAGAVYLNRRTGTVFPHDFTPHGNFDDEYPVVAERYSRRAARLFGLISASRRVLVVWVDVPACPKSTAEDRRYVLEVLRRRWPDVEFDLLAFVHEDGRPASDAADVAEDRVRTVTFDYRDPREAAWLADNRLLGAWLRGQYSVADYRTPSERREWRRKRRLREYGRYAAKGLWSYLVNKCQYKLFVHLKKRLERKGVV